MGGSFRLKRKIRIPARGVYICFMNERKKERRKEKRIVLISGKVFLPIGYLDATDSDKFERIGVSLCNVCIVQCTLDSNDIRLLRRPGGRGREARWRRRKGKFYLKGLIYLRPGQ